MNFNERLAMRVSKRTCFEFLRHAGRLLPCLPELDDVAIILCVVGDDRSGFRFH